MLIYAWCITMLNAHGKSVNYQGSVVKFYDWLNSRVCEIMRCEVGSLRVKLEL